MHSVGSDNATFNIQRFQQNGEERYLVGFVLNDGLGNHRSLFMKEAVGMRVRGRMRKQALLLMSGRRIFLMVSGQPIHWSRAVHFRVGAAQPIKASQ